jgi:hypothetical protein
MIEDARQGVKSKPSTKFIQSTAKLPAQEGISEES